MPPCDAVTTVYGVQKVRYRLYDRDGEAELNSRLDHIYDVQDKHFYSLKDVLSSCKAAGQNKQEEELQGSQAVQRSTWMVDEAEEERRGDIGGVAKVGCDGGLEENDSDLLVSCWAARLWKEAEGDLKKPITWEDFKRITSQKRRFGKTPMLGGGALGLAGAF